MMSTVDQILRTLKLSTGDVSNVYLVGSRLYNERPAKSSDYDVIIIRSQSRKEIQDVEAIHRNNVDAVVLSQREFLRRTETHLIERMCLSLPLENILMENFSVTRRRIATEEFVRNAQTRHEHTLHKASKFRDKGNISDMRKLLLHALRDRRLFGQIMESPEGLVGQFIGLIPDEEEYADDETLWSLCNDVTYP
jgi:hypothetical protein